MLRMPERHSHSAHRAAEPRFLTKSILRAKVFIQDVEVQRPHQARDSAYAVACRGRSQKVSALSTNQDWRP
jgi:hypothetical protein